MKLPFLSNEDRSELLQLCKAEPESPELAFVTFARALGKDLKRDFRCANLKGYTLRGQDFEGVDLTGADLRGADLRDARNLDMDNLLLDGALLDENQAIAKADAPDRWLKRWATLLFDRQRLVLLSEIPEVLDSAGSTWSKSDADRAQKYLDAAVAESWPASEDSETTKDKLDSSLVMPTAMSVATGTSVVGQRSKGRSFWTSLTQPMTDIAITLGSSTSYIYGLDRGLLLNQPTRVAITRDGGNPKIMAVGDNAYPVLRTEHSGPFEIICPLVDGVISDIDVAEHMIAMFVNQATGGRRYGRGPHIVLVIPSTATPAERRIFRNAMVNAGGSKVSFITKSMAAALGAYLPVTEPIGSMIVHIGGSTSEVATLSNLSIFSNASVRVGGNKMDDAIVSYVRRHHNLLIGEGAAEIIKKSHGCAYPPADGSGETLLVKGRDLVNGVPKEIAINQAQISEALWEPIGAIVEQVRITLEVTSPDLSADIVDQGIVLTGGGALLQGIDEHLRNETGLPVTLADDPLTCVIRGAGMALEEPYLRRVLIQMWPQT